ncbi:MAG: hypothetical protein FGM61_09165 [Sediminibacterium sp.]|nr:hypothetical protein [Sediminibacterium sp.]
MTSQIKNTVSIPPLFTVKSGYVSNMIILSIITIIGAYLFFDAPLYLIVLISISLVIAVLLFINKKSFLIFEDRVVVDGFNKTEILFSSLEVVQYHSSSVRGDNILWLTYSNNEGRRIRISLVIPTGEPKDALLFLHRKNVKVETDSYTLNDLLKKNEL